MSKKQEKSETITSEFRRLVAERMSQLAKHALDTDSLSLCLNLLRLVDRFDEEILNPLSGKIDIDKIVSKIKDRQ